MLDNSSMRVEWDDNDKKQVEEAKKHYQNARVAGRLIMDDNGKAITNFHPSLLGFIVKETELKETEFAVRILDATGDRRLIWDASVPDQVKEAVKIFDEYLTKGWRAYSVDDKGSARRRIHRFDMEREEVFFEEKSLQTIMDKFVEKVKEEKTKAILLKSEKINEFVKFFKNTKLVPRTYPG